MAKLNPNSPLYNCPLPEIENWLKNMGCQQDPEKLNYWYINKDDWQAELVLEIEDICVSYLNAGNDGSDIKRAFPYSLSLRDVEDAVFSGP